MAFSFDNLAGSNSTAVMGIINLSPDSFYSRSSHSNPCDVLHVVEKMALALLDKETLNASEVKEIINGKIPSVGGDETKVESEGVAPPSAQPTQKKSNDDSGGIMGGGLPDPHPA